MYTNFYLIACDLEGYQLHRFVSSFRNTLLEMFVFVLVWRIGIWSRLQYSNDSETLSPARWQKLGDFPKNIEPEHCRSHLRLDIHAASGHTGAFDLHNSLRQYGCVKHVLCLTCNMLLASCTQCTNLVAEYLSSQFFEYFSLCTSLVRTLKIVRTMVIRALLYNIAD